MVEQHSTYIFIYLLCTRNAQQGYMYVFGRFGLCMYVCVRACICDQKNCLFEVLLLEDLPLE